MRDKKNNDAQPRLAQPQIRERYRRIIQAVAKPSMMVGIRP
jgi:hypothetical protein